MPSPPRASSIRRHRCSCFAEKGPFESVIRAAQALLLGGAIAFYLSDLFVARDRFVAEGFTNRLLGLPLYYAGQYLLAFSVGVVST